MPARAGELAAKGSRDMTRTHRKRRVAAVTAQARSRIGRYPTLAQAVALAALGAGTQLELLEAHEPVYVPQADVSVDAPSRHPLAANADRHHLEYMLPEPVVSVPLTGQSIRTTLGRVTVSQTPAEPVQLSLALRF